MKIYTIKEPNNQVSTRDVFWAEERGTDVKYPNDYINKIIHGDCVEVIKGIPDESIDMVLTSPPYDNLRDYKGYSFNYQNIAEELFRIIKRGGVVVWVVGDQVINGSESGNSFRQALSFVKVGFNLHDTMIYKKDSGSYPDKTRYTQIFEYMFVFSKAKPKTINLIKDSKNKWGVSWGKMSARLKNGELRKRRSVSFKEYGVRSNVWEIGAGYMKTTLDTEAYKHPAMFPEKLARDHILSWSNENDIVLDPMCGSGTTCKMAKVDDRKYIGIDICKQYCEIARKRVDAFIPNMKLFKEKK